MSFFSCNRCTFFLPHDVFLGNRCTLCLFFVLKPDAFESPIHSTGMPSPFWAPIHRRSESRLGDSMWIDVDLHPFLGCRLSSIDDGDGEMRVDQLMRVDQFNPMVMVIPLINDSGSLLGLML